VRTTTATFNDSALTTRLPEVAPHDAGAEPGGPPEPIAGSLVVGSAARRTADSDLPGFYRPSTPPAPPRPYSDSALLTKYTEYDRTALQEAWALVGDQMDRLVSTFYAELFLRLREAMSMFPSQMTNQRQEFGKALVQWVVTDDPDIMAAHLQQLGADHRKFDVEPRHYEVAGAALASAWKTLAGARWTQRHEAAVLGSYARLASTMLDGAMAHLHEPASWGAQVIAHQQILSDFAVVRIQPDEPYPYKAGQYLTLELPSHRRVWRPMSIASAPRADNSFDIHVRAVGGLGLSATLVRSTKVGDRLRLGPPRGNDLVVEPGTLSSGLMCIASGTGAAPISAVVESVLAWREPPDQLDVFVGGRTREDIYPVDSLNRLIQSRGQWGRARAHGVVSDDPAYAGYRGRVESVVPMLRDWAALGVDVLIAGPNPMIEAAVTNLTVNRVPLTKIHFDQYEVSAA
ncbi:MAG: FAD-binding oxidoreductase, partial [Jatrophihabitantaceae bacterium]